MASPTYTADVLVLKKTKLGESDLILTCLASDGQQLRCVAKGARKPGGSFSSRLEIYSLAHVLLVQRPGLDIVKEAKLVAGHDAIRCDLMRGTAAAPICEVLARLSIEGLANPNLFPMSVTALDCLEKCDTNKVPLIVSAHFLKAFAYCGLSPSLTSCVSCGRPFSPSEGSAWRFSFDDGGIICPECKNLLSSIQLDPFVLDWARLLLYSRFSQITEIDAAESVGLELLRFCQGWAKAHLGAPLKALDFMIAFAIPD